MDYKKYTLYHLEYPHSKSWTAPVRRRRRGWLLASGRRYPMAGAWVAVVGAAPHTRLRHHCALCVDRLSRPPSLMPPAARGIGAGSGSKGCRSR